MTCGCDWEALDVSENSRRLHLFSGVSWVKGRIKYIIEEDSKPSNC